MRNAEYVTGAGPWPVYPPNRGGPGWYSLKPGAFIVFGLPGLARALSDGSSQVVWD